MRCCQTQRGDFERSTDLVNLAHLVRAERTDACAAIAMEDDPSLAFQLAQGFKHRDAADTEMPRQVLLPQGFARSQLALNDCLSQGLGDHLGRALSPRQGIVKIVACILHGILYKLSNIEATKERRSTRSG